MKISRAVKTPEFIVAIILLAVMVIVGIINPLFWGLENIFKLLRENIVFGIMGLGVLIVLISGGIDVSFPSFAVASMYITIKLMVFFEFNSVFFALITSVALGAFFGSINAFFVSKFKMIPLIVTLGSASLVRGLLLGVVGTSLVNINKMPKSLINFSKVDIISMQNSDSTTYGLTAIFLVYIFISLLIHFFLKYTLLGRSIYAYGGDSNAALRAGISSKKVLFTVYMLAGVLAGLAGILHSSMLWLANPRDFIGTDLFVIAAVVLGGASIFGGKGSVLGVMLGVFTLVLVKNSLILMHIPTTWQLVVIGAIIILATAFSSYRKKTGFELKSN